MHVSFSARHYDIHPDTHGLGRRSHHVVHPIVGLHAERQRGVRALWCGRARQWKRREGKRGEEGEGTNTRGNVVCALINEPTHFVCILQVVVVDLLYGLEVNDSFHLGLVLVCSREGKHVRSWRCSTF